MKIEDQQHEVPVAIKGFLIDIDGVLYVEKRPIQGSMDALRYLQKLNIPFLLVTNTTRRSRFSLLNNLQRLGFKVDLEQIFSAPYAAAKWLVEKQAQSVYLYLKGDAYREFADFRITTHKPDYVVVGDIGEDLTYRNLNQTFRLIMDGARILALQKNRFWLRSDGLSVDAGAIVAALEYASNKKATIVGKPNKNFFNQALKKLNLPAENVAMIGDDFETDIEGGAKAGLYTIAVETGKFKQQKTSSRKKLPHHTLQSIGELPQWLEQLKIGT